MERFKAQLHTLWQAILMPEILLPAAFIFLWQVSTLPLLCISPRAPSPDMLHGPMDTPENFYPSYQNALYQELLIHAMVQSPGSDMAGAEHRKVHCSSRKKT